MSSPSFPTSNAHSLPAYSPWPPSIVVPQLSLAAIETATTLRMACAPSLQVETLITRREDISFCSTLKWSFSSPQAPLPLSHLLELPMETYLSKRGRHVSLSRSIALVGLCERWTGGIKRSPKYVRGKVRKQKRCVKRSKRKRLKGGIGRWGCSRRFR